MTHHAIDADLQSVAHRFVQAVVGQRAGELAELLDDAVDFRAQTPGRAWQAHDPDGVCAIVFGNWFPPEQPVTAVLATDVDDTGPVPRCRYRMVVQDEGEYEVVEQQAYLTVVDERITRLLVVCTGFHPFTT